MLTYSNQILRSAFTLDHGLKAKDTAAIATQKSTAPKDEENLDETSET